ncbi:hypothetical protein N657DRAFT_667757 [Parathielavia appendiculata]|uniref:Uncharacterized protein n=1 Tax=Parathielavia appendiculata TaxID=2587402 RepID=A0AAN6U8P5_9PEZI|nr:hypothetical protein N657DRAFT_667757 [Parathielavia appendiculata]
MSLSMRSQSRSYVRHEAFLHAITDREHTKFVGGTALPGGDFVLGYDHLIPSAYLSSSRRTLLNSKPRTVSRGLDKSSPRDAADFHLVLPMIARFHRLATNGCPACSRAGMQRLETELYADLDKQTTICIRGVSVYGQAGVLAQNLEHCLEPSSHDPGSHHLISVSLVALLRLCDEQKIQDWANTGGHFVQLEWTFPGSNYPKFTTRHALNKSETLGRLSFSGGIGWAQRMLETAKELDLTNPPARGQPRPSTWDPVGLHGGPKMPLQLPPLTCWVNQSSFPGSLMDFVPRLEFMDGASKETCSDTGTSHASSDLGDNMEGYLTSDFLHGVELADSPLIREQLRNDSLRRQRAGAELIVHTNRIITSHWAAVPQSKDR